MSIEDTHRIRVDIFGQDYFLRGTEPPVYLRQIAHLVDDKMREIAETNSRLDTQRIAVLTAVNFADQLMRLRNEYEELLRVLEDKV